MTVGQFLTAVNQALRATDDEAPTVGTEEADYWIGTLNRKISEAYRNAKVLFDATWSEQSVGTISASAAPQFELDNIIAPSDSVYVLNGTQRTDFTVIKPRERSTSVQQVYIAGVNPQTLYFTSEITADQDIVGGTLYVPGYYMPDEVVNENDDLPLSDPYWGVMSVAAEIAFNDIVYEDKAEGLNAKANNLYMQMVRANRRGTYANPRVSAHNHYRIRGTEVN